MVTNLLDEFMPSCEGRRMRPRKGEGWKYAPALAAEGRGPVCALKHQV